MSTQNHRVEINAENPWPGLLSFPEGASRYFHGRDGDTDELMRLVKREPLSVLFGQSGLGKTSLLNAGLFPRLRDNDFLPIYLRLDTSSNSLPYTEQVKAVLASTMQANEVDAPLPGVDETLWEYFHRRDTDLWSKRNRLLMPVLVFDQFEEIFTTGQRNEISRQHAGAMLDEIATLVENRVPAAVATALELNPDKAARLDFSRQDYRVLLSFREDFLPEFEGLRKRIPSIMQNRMRLNRMSGLQALEVVEQGGSALVEAGVAAQIVRFVAGDKQVANDEEQDDLARLEIEPALLSVVCRELNIKRQNEHASKISGRLLTGAHRAIIDDFYKRSVEDLDASIRIFVENQLITEAGYRDSYALDDAVRLPGVTREAIDTLVTRRLLRLEERFGSLRIELTHDVLTGVIKEARDTRKAEEDRIENAARIKRQRRRTRQVASGAVFMGVLAVAFAALAVQATSEKSRAVRAQSSALFSQALLELDNQQPQQALRSLAGAIELNPANQAAVARTVSLLSQRKFVAAVGIQSTSSKMWAVAASRDGKKIASAAHDGTVRVTELSAENSRPVRLRLDGRLSAVAFSPDGKTIAAASDQGYAKLWRYALYPEQSRKANNEGYWEEVSTLSHAGVVNSVAFSEDGQQVVTSSADSMARIWMVMPQTNPKPVFTLQHQGPVNNAIFNPTDDRVITISDDGSTRVWDSTSGRQLLKQTQASAVKAMAVSHDGRLIATGTVSGSILVWDSQTGTVTVQVRHDGAVNSLEFSPDDNMLVSASSDQTARLWSARSGINYLKPLQHRGVVLSAHFDASGNRVVTNSWDGSAVVWDVSRSDIREVVAPLVHDGQVLAAAFIPGGNRLVTTTSTGRCLLWDIQERSQALQTPGDVAISRAILSPDGKRTATVVAESQPGLNGDRIIIWNNDSRQVETEIGPTKSIIRSITFNSQGNRLVTGEKDGTLEQWDVLNGKAAAEPVPHAAAVLKVAVDSHDQYVAVGYADGIATIRNMQTGKTVLPALQHGGAVYLLAFSPDGQRLATASRDGVVRVWDVNSGIPYTTPLQHNGRVNVISFSPDGRSLLTAGEDGYANVWNALYTSANTPLQMKHPGIVFSARYSHDGKSIVTACIDGVVRIWDSKTLLPSGIELTHSNVALSAEYSKDDRWIVTSSFDRSVQVWDALSGQPVADRMVFPSLLDSVVLDAEGKRLLTLSGGRAELRELSLSLSSTMPDWLPVLARAIADDTGIDNLRSLVREAEASNLPDVLERHENNLQYLEEQRDSGPDNSQTATTDIAAARLVAGWYAGITPPADMDWSVWANQILQDNFPREKREVSKP